MRTIEQQSIDALRQYIKENGCMGKTLKEVSAKDPRQEQLEQLKIIVYTRKEEAK